MPSRHPQQVNACLLLAVTRSWPLTLVILSTVPFLTIIQFLSQILVAPLLASDRSTTATSATQIDHAVTSISTVKAFNAEAFELDTITRTFDGLSRIARTLNAIWGATTALAQFAVMAMFVQGFWYGARLVGRGKITPGDVMTVFWACLIATSNLQMCIPQILTLSKGKSAMASPLALMNDEDEDIVLPAPTAQAKTTFPRHRRSRSARLSNICPGVCMGEVSLRDVTFTHATRSAPTISNVSLYFPAHEMTFIIGSSGSGKSTIAELILGMYAPGSGEVRLDESEVRYLDPAWMRGSVVGIGQGWGVDVVLEGGLGLGANDRDWPLRERG